MTAATLTLTDFLAARYDEDEAIARAAQAGLARWQTDEDECCVLIDDGYKDATETHFNGTAVHIARWDPARVLAECEAKRRIITFLAEHHEWDEPHLLKLLALPYADHPDFRDEWRA